MHDSKISHNLISDMNWFYWVAAGTCFVMCFIACLLSFLATHVLQIRWFPLFKFHCQIEDVVFETVNFTYFIILSLKITFLVRVLQLASPCWFAGRI